MSCDHTLNTIYLLISNGASVNFTYPVGLKKSTILIEGLKQICTKFREQIYVKEYIQICKNEVNNLLGFECDPSLPDSDGHDAWMNLILLNNYDLLDVMISYFYKNTVPIDNDLKDKFGKSHLHLIVNPNKFGWIKNTNILELFLKHSLGKLNAKDNQGRTAYELAAELRAPDHLKIFEDNSMLDEKLKITEVENSDMEQEFTKVNV